MYNAVWLSYFVPGVRRVVSEDLKELKFNGFGVKIKCLLIYWSSGNRRMC